MTWFAFQGLNGGKAIDIAGLQEKYATGEGFHGYATEADAEAKPNAVNPLTRFLAESLIADYNAALSTQSQPGGKNASNLGIAGTFQNAASSLAGAVGGAIPGAAQVGDFFARLTEKATWERVGEVAIGLILGYVAIKALLTPAGANPATHSIASTVKKVRFL